MNKQIKTLIALLTLSLWVLPLAINIIWSNMQTQWVRKQVNYELLANNTKNLSKLILNQKEMEQLNWQHADEFEYQGEMYDVLKQEHSIGKTTFICYKDSKESKLKQNIKWMWIQLLAQTPWNKHQNKLQQNQWKKDYWPIEKCDILFLSVRKETKPLCLKFELSLYSNSIFNPPECC